MTPAEVLKEEMAQVRAILGEPPVQPIYPDAYDDPQASVGRKDHDTGVSGVSNPQGQLIVNPNNALLAADYQAQLAAYSAEKIALLARLRELKKGS